MRKAMKNFLFSKTFQGILIMLLAYLLPKFGVVMGDDELASMAVDVGMALGTIWALYGRVTAAKQITLGKAVPTLLLIAMLLPACAAWKSATPTQKASITAQESAKAYIKLHDVYLNLHAALPDNERTMLESKVAPIMNTLKKTLIVFTDATILWNNTGTKPPDYDQLQESAEQLLLDVTKCLSAASANATEGL